ncbi:t-SNARE [Endogone sp. FLAS-F59071]|nr:t-SNARE [Endogone sp. FLAS-F59071]|eukprot:RUS12625.1 t-SNARE [Endogone sp. FLAS-F59071]
MASVDRLAQLRGKSFNDMPVPMQNMGGSADSYNIFLDEAANIQDVIRQINDETSRIKSLQARLLDSTADYDQDRVRRELAQCSDEQQKRINSVKSRIRDIEPVANSPDFGIRKNQFSGVTRSFMDAISKYRTVETDFQRAESRLLERQIRIVNPNASQREIDDALDQAREGGRPIFMQSLVGGRRDQAAGTLQAVQDRHEDIQRLVRTITELTQLFDEMQDLVATQGKVIDTIEASTYEANVQLKDANAQLDRATKSAWATRHKKWICFWISVIVVIVIVIVLLWYFNVIPHSAAGSSNTSS